MSAVTITLLVIIIWTVIGMAVGVAFLKRKGIKNKKVAAIITLVAGPVFWACLIFVAVLDIFGLWRNKDEQRSE